MSPRTATPRKRKKRSRVTAKIVKTREADKPGPDTSRLVIEGSFEAAVRKALSKRVR